MQREEDYEREEKNDKKAIEKENEREEKNGNKTPLGDDDADEEQRSAETSPKAYP